VSVQSEHRPCDRDVIIETPKILWITFFSVALVRKLFASAAYCRKLLQYMN